LSTPEGLTTIPGLMLGTKLNSKITNVGSTNNRNNQIPAGLSNTKGSTHFPCGRFFSGKTTGSAPSVAPDLGREGGVMLVDTGNYRVEGRKRLKI
jgi:hypothetical protein